MHIVIVGAGYVGLVGAACFARKGYKVTLVEKDSKKRDCLSQGDIPFFEPGLHELVIQGVEQKRLTFLSTIGQALEQKPDVLFLCVGTPSLDDGSVDLSAVYEVAQDIGKHLSSYCLIVSKSTAPVGTTEVVKKLIEQEIARQEKQIPFDVAFNPEFLKQGSAVTDMLYPDRIVVGASSEKAISLLRTIYDPFLTAENQWLVMSPESAELTKYASNTMLASRISFMNQLARLADKVGADIEQVREGMSSDKRIGSAFLNAGIGYGGSCFTKDVKALVHMGKEHNVSMTFAQETDAVNDGQWQWFIDMILNHYGNDLTKKTVGIWGLSFKPNTDDIRGAPSINVITALRNKVTSLQVYDPVAMDSIKTMFGNSITYAERAEDILNQSDCLVILTEWKEFTQRKKTDFLMLREKVIFDARNCFDPIDMKNKGFNYYSVGRNMTKKRN